MKKRIVVATLVAAMALSLAACGSQGEAKTEAAKETTAGGNGANEKDEKAAGAFVIKMGTTSSAKGMPSRSAENFKTILEEVSGGAMSCDINIASALGNTAQHYAQMKDGSLGGFVTAYDTFNIMQNGQDFSIAVVPYAFDDMEHFHKWIDSDLYKEMVAAVEEPNNVKVIGPIGDVCPRGLSTSGKPVKSVADVKNLKIRVPETKSMVAVWEAWGANPTIIPASEIYTSLDSKIADGQENDVLTTNNSAYAEVQDYYMELDYIMQSEVLVLSGTVWKQMDEQQQKWVMEAAQKAQESFTAQIASEYEEAKEHMQKELNVEFIDVDVQSFRDAAAGAISEMNGDLFSDGLYDKIRALAD